MKGTFLTPNFLSSRAPWGQKVKADMGLRHWSACPSAVHQEKVGGLPTWQDQLGSPRAHLPSLTSPQRATSVSLLWEGSWRPLYSETSVELTMLGCSVAGHRGDPMPPACCPRDSLRSELSFPSAARQAIGKRISGPPMGKSG